MTTGVPSLAAGAAGSEALKYVENPRELIGGNAVRLLRNGAEAYPVWLDAIDAAKTRVGLEMYIFNDGKAGGRFADALIRAARRGVQVRVLYDFIGCRDTPAAFFNRMRDAGVHTIAYHKYRLWRPRFWSLIRRDHRKLLVCDGRVAFTGGLNIADEWLPASEGGGDWHDAAVQVEGPAVVELEQIFLRTWNRRSRRRFRLDPATLAVPAPAGSTRLAVISNTELLDRFAIRRAALHAMRESQTRIYLANPYFVPDRGILRALCRAAGCGVDVRLIVPARSDTRLLDMAARATFTPLLRAGVRIWQSETVIHSKAVVVDDSFFSIGSYNFDHRSLTYNLEVVVNVLDGPQNQEVSRMLEDDMAVSSEILPASFARRTLLTRVLERLAYSLRHWL